MIENQSKNMGIFAVPAPGPVVIDGDLSDWDWSGRVISFADYTIREKYSVETAMMWDEEYFYVAFRWFDESPASNHFDPEFDAQVGWKGDSFAMRTVTDKTFWLTGWNFTGEDEEIIEYKEWNNPKSLKEGTQDHYYISEPGGVDIGEEMQMETRVVDGGYVQEIRVPWAKMYQDVPTIADGLRFKMGIEYIWGTPEGTGFPQHRYADNLQPGTDNRLFFWTATNAWGDVVLIGRNGIPLRQYSPLDSQMMGPVEISLEIPKGAKRFTVVVDDESGVRVRNLVGDVDPRDFAVSESEETYTVQVRWDGRDEFGEVAPVGQYQVRGLWHDGIGAYLDTVFYNPGSPPWKTADSSGDWGADHHPASLVSRAGDGMTLACRFAEGGDGIIAIGDDGTKAWGAKRGAVALTADADHTYAITTQHFHTGNLCRFSNADGSYAPFEEADTPVKFDVPLDLFIPGFQKKEKKGSPGT
ncbi:MAG: sugar-binding protein, partial [Puniceicoccales bacterium]